MIKPKIFQKFSKDYPWIDYIINEIIIKSLKKEPISSQAMERVINYDFWIKLDNEEPRQIFWQGSICKTILNQMEINEKIEAIAAVSCDGTSLLLLTGKNIEKFLLDNQRRL